MPVKVPVKEPRGKPQDEPQSGDVLDQGDERVKHLQRRLSSLGFTLNPDGRFGPKTAGAVKEFQRNGGLREDGIVGPITTAALKSAPHPDEMTAADAWDADGNGVPDTTTVHKTEPGKKPPPDSEMSPGSDGNLGGGTDFTDFGGDWMLYKGLGVGDVDPHAGVSELQGHLGDLGYDVENDGRFGPQTEKAVKGFQRKFGLRPDGLVGPKTRRTMHAAKGKHKKLKEAIHRRQTASSGKEFSRALAIERRLREEILQEAFDPAKHPRGRGGLFSPITLRGNLTGKAFSYTIPPLHTAKVSGYTGGKYSSPQVNVEHGIDSHIFQRDGKGQWRLAYVSTYGNTSGAGGVVAKSTALHGFLEASHAAIVKKDKETPRSHSPGIVNPTVVPNPIIHGKLPEPPRSPGTAHPEPVPDMLSGLKDLVGRAQRGEGLPDHRRVRESLDLQEANKGLESMIAALVSKGIPEEQAKAIVSKNMASHGAKRGTTAKAKIALKRLPDGTFAPKGQGEVLKAGQNINIDHGEGVVHHASVLDVKPSGAAVLSSHEAGFQVLSPNGHLSDTMHTKAAADQFADQGEPPTSDWTGPQVGSTITDKNGVKATVAAHHDHPSGDPEKKTFTLEHEGGSQKVGFKGLGDIYAGKSEFKKKTAGVGGGQSAVDAASPKTDKTPPKNKLASSSPAKEPEHKFGAGGSPGRGPTGKLRNFKAMSPAKLKVTIKDLQDFGKDDEALQAAQAVAKDKGVAWGEPDKPSASKPKAKASKPPNVSDAKSKKEGIFYDDGSVKILDSGGPNGFEVMDSKSGQVLSTHQDKNEAIAAAQKAGADESPEEPASSEEPDLNTPGDRANKAEADQFDSEMEDGYPDDEPHVEALTKKLQATFPEAQTVSTGGGIYATELEPGKSTNLSAIRAVPNESNGVDVLGYDQDDSQDWYATPGTFEDAVSFIQRVRAGGKPDVNREGLATFPEQDVPEDAPAAGKPAPPMSADAQSKAKPASEPSPMMKGGPKAGGGKGPSGAAILPETLSPNVGGYSLHELPLGAQFSLADGSQWHTHKFVNDPWMIAKPVGGGKAKPFHKMLAPPNVGPQVPGYEGASPGDTSAPGTSSTPDVPKATSSGDLMGELSKSVEISKKAKAKGQKPDFKAAGKEAAGAKAAPGGGAAANAALAAYQAAGGSDPAVIAALKKAA